MLIELIILGCLWQEPQTEPAPWITSGDCSTERVCTPCPYCGEDVCVEQRAHPDECRLVTWGPTSSTGHEPVPIHFLGSRRTYTVCAKQVEQAIERLIPGGKWAELP